jgi:hypothetical protein
MTADLFGSGDRVSEIVQLSNDLSHGSIPITPEVIDRASSHLKSLEEAAHVILDRIKRTRISNDPLD